MIAGSVIIGPDLRLSSMPGLLRLARPLNCMMSAMGVGIGAVVAVGAGAWGEFAVPVALAASAAASFTAGGNALNDIYDRDTDAINHPERPLPSGLIALSSAKAFGFGAFAVAAILAIFVNFLALAIVTINAALMFAYESRLKARGAPGNVVVALLVGSLFVFGGVAVYRDSTDPLVRSGFLASLAFLATLGREITKDIEDMRGDVDRRTLPQQIGARSAGIVAAVALLVGVGWSLLPLFQRILFVGTGHLAYAALVMPADGIFIYAAIHSAANPARSQRVTKYGMIVALAAFLAGAFL